MYHWNLAKMLIWFKTFLHISKITLFFGAFLSVDHRESLVTFMGLWVFGILGLYHSLKKIHSVLEEKKPEIFTIDYHLWCQKWIKSAECNLPSKHMIPSSPEMWLVLPKSSMKMQAKLCRTGCFPEKKWTLGLSDLISAVPAPQLLWLLNTAFWTES